MLYETPRLTPDLQSRLDELDGLRDALGHKVSRPLRWMGPLRRSLRASSFESSTSIEGYSVSPEEAIALVDGGAPADSGDENRQALACYARAMDRVGTLALDPAFRWLDRVILDLHFDACYYQPLEWCIANGYRRFEGGAQGEHKMARGLLPVQTWSAHWLAHPQFARAVDDFVAREGVGVESYLDELAERRPFKATEGGA